MTDQNNEENNELDVKSLVDQLKDSVKTAKNMQSDKFSLAKEDLEQFILDNTGKLIKDSMDTIDDIKQYIISAPEPDDVHSLAELYKASTSAIEALNKILIQQQISILIVLPILRLILKKIFVQNQIIILKHNR